jgi:hypothetical protein
VSVVVALLIGVPAALAATYTYTGSITPSDPTQAGRLVQDDPESTCTNPQTGSIVDVTPRHYDIYRLRNASGSTQCVTITLNPTLCQQHEPLQSAVYTPSFDPTDITANRLGDIGTSPIGGISEKSYSVNVPAGAAFDVTVNEVDPSNPGCLEYRLTVIGDGIVEPPPTAVTFLGLTAARAKRGVLLRWRTASEPNTVGYIIYRSQAGKRVRLTGKPIPAAREAGVHVYAWLDRNARRGARYSYRLQAVSPDGARSWVGTAVARG